MKKYPPLKISKDGYPICYCGEEVAAAHQECMALQNPIGEEDERLDHGSEQEDSQTLQSRLLHRKAKPTR